MVFPELKRLFLLRLSPPVEIAQGKTSKMVSLISLFRPIFRKYTVIIMICRWVIAMYNKEIIYFFTTHIILAALCPERFIHTECTGWITTSLHQHIQTLYYRSPHKICCDHWVNEKFIRQIFRMIWNCFPQKWPLSPNTKPDVQSLLWDLSFRAWRNTIILWAGQLGWAVIDWIVMTRAGGWNMQVNRQLNTNRSEGA